MSNFPRQNNHRRNLRIALKFEKNSTEWTAMHCAGCHQPMIVLELESIEIDYCLSCSGIWLDADELELLLGNSSRQKAFLASFVIAADTVEKKRKCPICRKFLQKINCGTQQKTLIDRCPTNHGLWFDRGELENILRDGTLDQEGKILTLFQKMFAHTLTASKQRRLT